jgi:hypothetical protein
MDWYLLIMNRYDLIVILLSLCPKMWKVEEVSVGAATYRALTRLLSARLLARHDKARLLELLSP